ncbi:Glucagon family neuropeptide [Willisornis vidua]|uniref:Glucagon family neuropeptide n=1 Tax=Willisornis vidua TaxID=1566151 RepID=A0ABQ9CLX9_9PASS|nr:Glucagon family neuropeptide [Willisornis vidua]
MMLEDEVYDEDGNTLQDFAYDHEPLGIANPSSMIGEMYTLYYPPEKRHADGIFNKAYRKLLGQLSARKYLHSLMAKRVGGASGGLGDEAEPLTKRHIDGIFTDSYSRYRKQMAVKKYLAAVLGKRFNPPCPVLQTRHDHGYQSQTPFLLERFVLTVKKVIRVGKFLKTISDFQRLEERNFYMILSAKSFSMANTITAY